MRKSILKKIIAISMTSVLFMGFLSGCGGSADGGNKTWEKEKNEETEKREEIEKETEAKESQLDPASLSEDELKKGLKITDHKIQYDYDKSHFFRAWLELENTLDFPVKAVINYTPKDKDGNEIIGLDEYEIDDRVDEDGAFISGGSTGISSIGYYTNSESDKEIDRIDHIDYEISSIEPGIFTSDGKQFEPDQIETSFEKADNGTYTVTVKNNSEYDVYFPMMGILFVKDQEVCDAKISLATGDSGRLQAGEEVVIEDVKGSYIGAFDPKDSDEQGGAKLAEAQGIPTEADDLKIYPMGFIM